MVPSSGSTAHRVPDRAPPRSSASTGDARRAPAEHLDDGLLAGAVGICDVVAGERLSLSDAMMQAELPQHRRPRMSGLESDLQQEP